MFPRAERYAMWTDLVFGRLPGVKRFREHTIDLLGDSGGKVVLDVGYVSGRNFPVLVRRVGAGDLFPFGVRPVSSPVRLPGNRS